MSYFFRQKEHPDHILWCSKTGSGNFEVINGGWWFKLCPDGKYRMNTKFDNSNGEVLDLEYMPVNESDMPEFSMQQYNEAIEWARQRMIDDNLTAMPHPPEKIERRQDERRQLDRREGNVEAGSNFKDKEDDEIPF